MVEELLPGLYRIEVPLPKNPLREVNSYIIKGKDRGLVVDTGLNLPVCAQAWHSGLEEIGLSAENLDFFHTHMHTDHLALTASLASEDAKKYIGRLDETLAASAAQGVQNVAFWQAMVDIAYRNGFPEGRGADAIQRHPSYSAGPQHDVHFTTLHDGDTLEVGDYHFECVWTPGHTAGHLCLYDHAQKLFLSGDHILGDITPVIGCWNDHSDPLGDYLKSLTKVGQLEVERVLPGHRGIIQDLPRRIEELRQHHQTRLDEVLGLLQQGEQTAYQIAGGMTWDIKFDSWASFPLAQQWFATGEANSHLVYLAKRGMALRTERDGLIVYRLS